MRIRLEASRAATAEFAEQGQTHVVVAAHAYRYELGATNPVLENVRGARRPRDRPTPMTQELPDDGADEEDVADQRRDGIPRQSHNRHRSQTP